MGEEKRWPLRIRCDFIEHILDVASLRPFTFVLRAENPVGSDVSSDMSAPVQLFMFAGNYSERGVISQIFETDSAVICREQDDRVPCARSAVTRISMESGVIFKLLLACR